MSLKRVVGWLFGSILFALSGARGLADMIGYATLPDDARVASDLADKFVLRLLDVPGWLLLAAAFAAFLWLIYSDRTMAVQPISAKPLKVVEPSLAHKCLHVSLQIRHWEKSGHRPFYVGPDLHILEAQCLSALFSLEKQGFGTPPLTDRMVDNFDKVAIFLGAIGTLLSDGNKDEAKRLSHDLAKSKIGSADSL